MVGVSRKDIAALGRWFGGLSVGLRAVILGALALAILGIGWWSYTKHQEARLVRVAPDSLPAQAALMHYAVGHGRGLYQSHCASCHGADGKGSRTLGAANLTDKDWLYGEGEVSDIETVVLYGIRAPDSRTWKLADMPAFARPVPYEREKAIKPLAPTDINDLIQFLRSLRGAKSDAEAATRGAALFANRGGCYDCHAGDARGDPAIGGPNLSDDIWLYGDGSDQWVFQTIAYGRAGVCPGWSDKMSSAQIREVSLYVYSLSHGGGPPQSKVAQLNVAKPSPQ